MAMSALIREGVAMTSSDVWSAEEAERYDEASAFMYASSVLEPAVGYLATLAGAGPALEFAIGTGRVAIPLIDRGVAVSGIELSPAMVEQLRKKGRDVPVVVGDMATSTVPGEFSLVYLVWNGLGNVRTQSEQVACFQNAARHLAPGGRFVVELWVPGIRRYPPGQAGVPFHIGEHHVGLTPTTWPRSRAPPTTTGDTTTAAPRTARAGSGTCGPLNATSWHSSRGWIWRRALRTGRATRSPTTAKATCPSGGSLTSASGGPEAVRNTALHVIHLAAPAACAHHMEVNRPAAATESGTQLSQEAGAFTLPGDGQTEDARRRDPHRR